MPAATRIYLVTDRDTDEQKLVRATNAATAIRHAAKRFSAVVAAPETLVEMCSAGAKVEDAGEEPEPPTSVAGSSSAPGAPAPTAPWSPPSGSHPPAPAIPRDISQAA